MSRPKQLRHLLPCLGALALLGIGRDALAQAGDVEKPLPNVLMLMDTSGSMEFRAEDNAFPTCSATPNNGDERSRWIDLVEVMTGTFDGYSCFAQDRSTDAFRQEYTLGSEDPYDFGYVNPYHRVISNGCAIGPGVLPSANNPYEFPPGAVLTFPFAAPDTVTRPSTITGNENCAGFSQSSDGLLDIFREKVRFGLMTFDTHVDAGTGLTSGNADHADGIAGTWSYHLNNTPITGRPAGCTVDQVQEVGARNAAAPPWEGRMVAFGAPESVESQVLTRNNYVQQILLSTRPYGATPIAGLLHDAREFLWYDTTLDPLDPTGSLQFGPGTDPTTLVPNCRRNIIILFSDGEPNLDLRPYCESGICPYDKPELIAQELHDNPPDPDQAVEVIVVGFALNKVTPAGSAEIGCAELTQAHCDGNPNDRGIQACCTLNRIAELGSSPQSDGTPRKAYFPQNRTELRRSFSEILMEVTSNLTTRTATAYSSATTSGGGAHRYNSGFFPVVEQPWHGTLTRTRIECDSSGVPVAHEPDRVQGDDFVWNVNSTPYGQRKFITVTPAAGADVSNTLRPQLPGGVTDGIGTDEGQQTSPGTESDLVLAVTPQMAEVTAATCGTGSAVACRDQIMNWYVGMPAAVSGGETRCEVVGTEECNRVGAIYHSTPQLVSGPPDGGIRNESYDIFLRAQQTARRPSVLYTSTVDGMLHAFKTAPHPAETTNPDYVDSDQDHNELWAFIPPAVLPVIQSQYPNTPAELLDDTPVIKDVVATSDNVFERTAAQARTSSGTWRTILVQGFGHGQVGTGYFAMDITNPVATDSGGPRFLWQITNDASGAPLFGAGGTPTITTLFIDDREIPVAILPGGDKGSREGTAALTGNGGVALPSDVSTYTPHDTVSDYTAADEARSLTIVRLDSGEIIKTFRATGTTYPPIETTLVEEIDIPAPIVGQPAAYPGDTGEVADRVFVGDKEGRLWRLDVSSPSPDNWTFKVFADAYADMTTANAMLLRQPIVTKPILSVDDSGQVTVAASTGSQRMQTIGSDMLNRVLSVTELFATVGQATVPNHAAHVNWYESFGCQGTCAAGQHKGERVTGPMSLYGGVLYFATSSPGETLAGQCAGGSNRIWGLHYTLNDDEELAVHNPSPASGGAPRLPNPDPNATRALKASTSQQGMVFGVGVQQDPNCVTRTTGTDDPFLGGYGSHSTLDVQSSGSFSLVYQVAGVGSQGVAQKPRTVQDQLEPPQAPAWFSSWARVFE